MKDNSSSKILKALENSLFQYSNQLFVIEAAVQSFEDEHNAATGIKQMVHQMACDLIEQQYSLSDIAEELEQREQTVNNFNEINCSVFINSLNSNKTTN